MTEHKDKYFHAMPRNWHAKIDWSARLKDHGAAFDVVGEPAEAPDAPHLRLRRCTDRPTPTVPLADFRALAESVLRIMEGDAEEMTPCIGIINRHLNVAEDGFYLTGDDEEE